MDSVKGWITGIADEAAGIAKRAIGELTARPDFVLEGEKQQALGRAKVAIAQGGPKHHADHHRVIGWKLDPAQRTHLLAIFPPRYDEVVADHVTLAADVPPDAPLPMNCEAKIVGEANDGEGVQALVIAINGRTERPDGGTFHITWSLAPGRHASQSNDVLARQGWQPLTPSQILILHPASM